MTEAAAVTTTPAQTVNPAPATPPAAPDSKAAPATTGTNTASGQETPKPEAPAKPEMFEIKVNGKSLKVTKEELIRRAQISEAATERFEQAAAKEKQIQAILAKTKSNPIGALMETGLTKDEAREAFEAWYSAEYIEPEALTKEQRELKAAQEELKRYKAKEAEIEAKARAEKEEMEVAAAREMFQKQIINMIDEYKLPKTKLTVSRIAFYMQQAKNKGFDAPPELIAQQVMQEREYLIQEIPDGADYDALVRLYGENVVKRIISEHLKHIRKQRGSVVAAPAEVEPQKTNGGKISMREAEEKLKRLMGRA